MTRYVPHIYEHFEFEEQFQPENITVKFNSDTLVFVFQGKPVTIERIFEIINSGRKVIRKDFQ
jgi:hypothetical protein